MPTKTKPKISSNYFSLSKSVLVETFIKKNPRHDYVLSMNKIVPFMLIFFFINGSFIVAFNPVLASELVENSWTEKTSMNTERSRFGVTVVNDFIYVIGGGTNGEYSAVNERYNPKLDSWTTLSSMPTPRSMFAIAAYQDKIYCMGGITANYAGPMVARGLDVNEVYDITTDSWSTKAPLPFSGYSQAHVIDGKIFVITQDFLYMYDPVTDSWTTKTSMPTSIMYNAFSVILDNKLLIVSTVTFYDIYNSEQKTIIYDPKTNTWDEKTAPDYFMIISGGGGAGVTTGRYAPIGIYALGFTDTGSTALSNQVYDPKSDTWTFAKDMPTKQKEIGVAVVDDILYIIGNSFNYQYVPLGYFGAIPDPEPSKTFPVFEQPNTSKPLPNNYNCIVVVAILILLVSLALICAFLINSQKKQKKHLTKFFVIFLIALIISCLVIGFFTIETNKTAIQDKPVDQDKPANQNRLMTQEEHISFMKNVLLIDVAKYSVELKSNVTLDLYPGIYAVRSDLLYKLTSNDSDIDVAFAFENYTLSHVSVYDLRGQVFTTKQYTNQADAVEDLLKRYQTYTNTDSSTLIDMLKSVDATKDTILFAKDLRFAITHYTFGGIDISHYAWTYSNSGGMHIGVSLEVDKMGNFRSIVDSRAKLG